MYESFYGLKDKPFSMLPDPDFLYLGKKHQTALTMLQYGIMNQASFCVISGETGAGKTTLIRALLNDMSDDITVGLITNTHQSFGDLLDWVLAAFAIEKPPGDKVEKHQAFVDFLLDQYAKNRTTLLVVDEAQNMNAETLEELRMLSNVNSEKDQVLQIILAGQPALRDTLRQPELMQFAQRISVDYHLDALNIEETSDYIHHRLNVAGCETEIFTDDATDSIYDHSGGIPRLINLLCDTSLVYGYAEQVKQIDDNLVEDVVRERLQNSVVPIVGNISSKKVKRKRTKKSAERKVIKKTINNEINKNKPEEEESGKNQPGGHQPAESSNSEEKMSGESADDREAQDAAIPDADQELENNRVTNVNDEKSGSAGTDAEDSIVDAMDQSDKKTPGTDSLPQEGQLANRLADQLARPDHKRRLHKRDRRTTAAKDRGKKNHAHVLGIMALLLVIVFSALYFYDQYIEYEERLVAEEEERLAMEHEKQKQEEFNRLKIELERMKIVEKEKERLQQEAATLKDERDRARKAAAEEEKKHRAALKAARAANMKKRKAVEASKKAMKQAVEAERLKAELEVQKKQVVVERRKAAAIAAQERARVEEIKAKIAEMERQERLRQVEQQNVLLEQERNSQLVPPPTGVETPVAGNQKPISKVEKDKGFKSDPCASASARFLSKCR